MGALHAYACTLREVERVSYEDAFLIGDLLSQYISVAPGEPKAGKTLLAAGMCAALLSGESVFCGYPVHRRLERVAWGLTDEGADGELRERFPAEHLDRVLVFPVRLTSDPNYWTDLANDLLEANVGLFVLDNILGSLGAAGDISDPVTAQQIVLNLRQISGIGIPVLALTHTPKGSAEGLSSASSPIGGRAIAAGARSIITLRRDKKRGSRIVVDANRARAGGVEVPIAVTFSEGAEVPIWTRRPQRAKPEESGSTQKAAGKQRTSTTLDKAAEAVQLILTEQPPAETSWNALANAFGPRVDIPPNTLRPKLRAMIEPESGRWRRRELIG